MASCVIRVSDLDRSLKFYCDAFSCQVVIRWSGMALLVTSNGFQLYLHADNRFRHRGAGTIGVHYLMWAVCTSSKAVAPIENG